MHTRADIIDAMTILGNGDIEQGKRLLVALAERLAHARTRHPVFAVGMPEAWVVVHDEMHEVAMAIANETPERVQDELLDVLATAVRFYNGEQK